MDRKAEARHGRPWSPVAQFSFVGSEVERKEIAQGPRDSVASRGKPWNPKDLLENPREAMGVRGAIHGSA